MKLYCCMCEAETECKLTDGLEIYPHRPDLASLPFWKCGCGGYVGCHHKSPEPTKPLGVIVSPEIKRLRQKIHAVLDPLWKSKRIKRKHLYVRMSECLGHEYHTAEIRTVQEAQQVLVCAESMLATIEEQEAGQS